MDEAARLAVVGEELRVADEEVRVQQKLIEELVRGRSAERLSGLRLTAALPVAVMETDRDGRILEANPAVARMLHMGSARLRGKPFAALVEPAGRRALRTALTRRAAEGGTEHLSVRLTPRRGETLHVDMAVVGSGEPIGTGPDGRVLPSESDSPVIRIVLAARVDPGAAVDTDLLSALGSISTLSVVDNDLQTLLTRLSESAVQGIAPAVAASLVVGPPARPSIVVATSRTAQDGDGAQFRASGGPSWEAYETGTVVTSTAIHADERWPALRTARSGGPIDAVVALPLTYDEDTAGVLTFYGTLTLTAPKTASRAGLFADAAAALLREHAAIVELRHQEASLREALTSRAVIDQAKGILMAVRGFDADTAFAELVRLSQHNNVKLREVAQQLVTDVAGGSPPQSVVTGSRPAAPRQPSTGS